MTLQKVISTHVMQDNLLFPMLTIEETLMFTAEFRLPHSLSKSKKKSCVQTLIDHRRRRTPRSLRRGTPPSLHQNRHHHIHGGGGIVMNRSERNHRGHWNALWRNWPCARPWGSRTRLLCWQEVAWVARSWDWSDGWSNGRKRNHVWSIHVIIVRHKLIWELIILVHHGRPRTLVLPRICLN